MTTLTGSRATQAAYLLYIRRRNLITADQYQTEKAKLIRQEIAVEKRRAAAKAKAAERAAERKAAGIAKRKATLLAKKVKKISQADDVNSDFGLVDFWEPIREQTVRVLAFKRDTQELRLDMIMTVPKTYKEFRQQFLNALGAGSDIQHILLTSSRLLAVAPTPVQAVRLVQSFRDGFQHCVFTPMFNLMETRLNAAGAGSAKRYKQRINKLHELSEQYLLGVPEDKMEDVANSMGLKVVLYDALGEPTRTYNEFGRVGTLALSNTRTNHVEVGIVVRSDPKDVTAEELHSLWANLKETKTHYEFEGDIKDGLPRRINTLKGSYVLADPEREFYKKFNEEIDLRNIQLNATKYPELNEFIKAGRIVNGWSCELGGSDETGCIDLKKAYSQFKMTKYFNGFLGKIHQFRSGCFDEAFMREHVGYYRITITNEPCTLFQMLGLYQGLTTVMFSQEALFFADHGVTFTADMGAWGHRFSFDFPEYMLENRRYCMWAGRLGCDRETRKVTIPATSEFADHLVAEGKKVLYWKEDGLATVSLPVETRFTAHHLLGAITSYTRINMMEAMMKFRPEQLCRVVMDGIYYTGVAPTMPNFCEKPMNAAMSSMCWYGHSGVEAVAPPMSQIVRDSFLAGQGGSGKTYSVLTDPGFISPAIVVPCNTLGQDVKTKYDVPYITMHRFIGKKVGDKKVTPYRIDHRLPSVVAVDEITQYEAADVDTLRKLNPECLFIGIGDIDRQGRAYQCRNGDGNKWSTVWKPTGVDYFEFTEDRRSKDDELKALKLQIRAQMNAVRGEDDAMLMNVWASKNLPKHELNFKAGDVCIAGTHSTNKKLLELGVVSGYYKTGGHIAYEPTPGYEMRGSFTVHSFQGKTIEEGDIYIFINDLFEVSMLYTAVSRACHISQIKFIHQL